MTITVLKKDEHDTSNLQRLATCGRPVPWLKVALLDDDLATRCPTASRGRSACAGRW